MTTPVTYQNWELQRSHDFSHCSPEGYWAEMAWNAAIEAAKELLLENRDAVCGRLVVQIDLLGDLQTDLHLAHENIIKQKAQW